MTKYLASGTFRWSESVGSGGMEVTSMTDKAAGRDDQPITFYLGSDGKVVPQGRRTVPAVKRRSTDG